MLYIHQNNILTKTITKTLLLTVVTLPLWHCNGPKSSVSELADQSIHSAVANRPEPGTIFLYPERIPLEDGGFYNAERGMMFVPLNRSKDKTDIIAVEVYRFKASSKADPNTPPIFFLHGGPSFQGLERNLRQTGTFEERWQPFLDVADLVIISQRGIGPSKPTTLIETTLTPQPPDQPYDEQSIVQEYQNILAEEKKAWEDLGLDLSGFTVVEAADDINDVRLALGYDKIVIWGGSFGSHWGMAFMRNYPEVVERAVLRGMEGPDHTYDHPGHLWNVYKRVAEEAEQAPELEEFIPEGGLIAALETVFQKAENQPFSVNVKGQDVLFDGESIRFLARGYSSGLAGWPANVISLYNGTFDDVASRIVDDYEDRNRSFRTASYWMLDCGSGITPVRLAAHDADPAMEIFRRMNWGYKSGCSVWGSDLGDEFRQNFETDIPTVIVHGTWDTSTPYENALELVPYFKNSKFVTVVRGPHGSIRAGFRASKSFQEALFNFAGTGDFSQLPEQVEMPAVDWVLPKSP